MSTNMQDQEITQQLRRAKSAPDRNGPQRKAVLKTLIELSHSPLPHLKMFAAENFKECFKDFPALEDDVINAVYDLCEDQDSQVRMKGYEAINDVSAADLKYVKRNVDVLIQLLQTDDRAEVTIVKKALSRHMDLDTRETWGVFCDQISPQDDPADDEEKEIRDRIRTLLLAYLSGEAKLHIQRHVSNPENEEVLVSGLLKAVTKLDMRDVDIISNDILLHLPSYHPYSARGRELLHVILERCKTLIKDDIRTTPAELSESTRHLLELASDLTLTKRVAHPFYLLRFYQSQLMSKLILARLAKDTQFFVIGHATDALAACDALGPTQTAIVGPAPEELAALKKQVIDTSAILFELLAESQMSELNALRPCQVLLLACKQRTAESKWTLPSNIITCLQQISARVAGQADAETQDIRQSIQDLIRSLSPPPPRPPATKPAPATASTSTNGARAKNGADAPRRLINRNFTASSAKGDAAPSASAAGARGPSSGSGKGPVSAPPSGPRSSLQRHAPPHRGLSVTVPTQPSPTSGTPTSGIGKHALGEPIEDSSRSNKRPKKGAGSAPESPAEPPSLLSRLGASTPTPTAIKGAASRLNPGAGANGKTASPLSATFPHPQKGVRQRQSPPHSAPSKREGRPNIFNQAMDTATGISIKGAAARKTEVKAPESQTGSLLDRLATEEQRDRDGGSRRRSKKHS